MKIPSYTEISNMVFGMLDDHQLSPLSGRELERITKAKKTLKGNLIPKAIS